MKGEPAAEIFPGESNRKLPLFLLVGLGESAFYGQLITFTPLYLPQLGVSADKIAYFCGLIGSVTMFTVFPALQKWGYLTEQLTRKQIVVRSLLLDAAVAAMAMIAGNVWIFLFGRAISILSMSSNGLLQQFMESSWLPQRSKPSIQWMALVTQFGIFLGPFIGGIIIDRIGFRFLAGINLILLLTIALAFSRSIEGLLEGKLEQSVFSLVKSSLASVIVSPRLSFLYLTLTLLVASWMLVFTYLPISIFNLSSTSHPGSVVGVVLGLGGAAGILLSYVLARPTKRMGEWKALVLIISAGSLGAFLAAEAKTYTQLFLLWMAINGLAVTGFSLLYNRIVSSSENLDVKQVLSLAVLPVSGGMILGPVIGTFITGQGTGLIFMAAMWVNLLALVSILLASRCPIPTEGK